MGFHEEEINSLLVAITDEYKRLFGAPSILRREELNELSMEQVKRIFLDAHCRSNSSASHSNGLASAVAFFNQQQQHQRKRDKKQVIDMRKVIYLPECGCHGLNRRSCFMLKNRLRNETQEEKAQVAEVDSDGAVKVPESVPNVTPN